MTRLRGHVTSLDENALPWDAALVFMPAIIEFSNREFYQGDIRPLRVPRANERLDPRLVDVFVKGGYRKGDINDPEAREVAPFV